MTWMQGALKGLGVFAYFVLFTVLLPDLIIGLDAVATASALVRDLLVLAIWGVAFVGGVWLLRRLQARGVI